MPASRPSVSSRATALSLTLALWAAPGLALAAGHGGIGPIHAHHAAKDDCAPCTRHAGREYRGALDRARRLADLDCLGLAADAECQRQQLNGHILGHYLRPFPTFAQGTSAAAPSIEPANAPPPPPDRSAPAPAPALAPK